MGYPRSPPSAPIAAAPAVVCPHRRIRAGAGLLLPDLGGRRPTARRRQLLLSRCYGSRRRLLPLPPPDLGRRRPAIAGSGREEARYPASTATAASPATRSGREEAQRPPSTAAAVSSSSLSVAGGWSQSSPPSQVARKGMAVALPPDVAKPPPATTHSEGERD